MDKKKAKDLITGLVSKYQGDIDNYRRSKYNETLLRSDFLDPFFEALGWDIKNQAGKPNNEREVILEEGLKADVTESSKKPDYTFRLFSERKFFVEAKKPNVPIENNQDSAKQIRRYGFTAKLKISVLSNFEYLAIYDCSENVKEDDGTKTALIKLYHFTEYEKKFKEINELLGRDGVYSGDFDETWSHIEDKINQFSVDDLFLEQINEWRLLLGTEIHKHQPDIQEDQLNDIVQSYLNSVIFLRVCEDRNLEEYKTLLSFATKEDFKALLKKFEEADKKYNSGLFDNQYKENIISDNCSVFWRIIQRLYYPESPYSFSVFSSDILGNIYEIFLTQKLTITDDNVQLEKKPEHADRDIITTPTPIVQDILRNTILPYCKAKNAKDILKSHFADIACGSGAFLLEAFQLLSDILVDYYLATDKNQLIQTTVKTYRLPFEKKKELLLKCIYGVDKDFNAVQACKFGLLLKLLESETNETIPSTKPILPLLDKNIHFGNSLLSSTDVKKADTSEINPFDFGKRKYDVIIGNPPYMKSEDMKNITPKELPLYKKIYQSAYKQFDKYYLFIERSIDLLNDSGFMGYIVPNKFIKVGAGKKLRELLIKSQNITQLISFGANQIFRDKTTYTCLLFLQKVKHGRFNYYEVDDLIEWKTRGIDKADYDSVDYANLSTDVWILVPPKLKNAFDNIKRQSISLGKLIGDENIYNGIQTSANDIYIHQPIKNDKKYFYIQKDGKAWKIEKEVTRPYFKTSSGNDNLYTYREFIPNSIVIYPYRKTEKGIEFIKLTDLKKNYPQAFNYLSYYKNVLSDPKRDIKPEPKTKNEWYRFGRHQSLDKCEVDRKIIVGVLSVGNKYAIDNYKTLISSGGTAGYCMITLPEDCKYSIYYLQAILNSKYVEWYSSLIGEVFRGGYIARGTKVLKLLPIREINFKDKKEKAIHDKIVAQQKTLIKTQKEIDSASGNGRKLIPLRRKFNRGKIELDKLLRELYQLMADDKQIPVISELYATN